MMEDADNNDNDKDDREISNTICSANDLWSAELKRIVCHNLDFVLNHGGSSGIQTNASNETGD